MPDRFVIVLPTYNERDNLERVVEAIAAVRGRAPFPGDVLIADDASPDGTGALADDLARRHDWVHVLHRPAKLGLGQAYVDGFRWALDRDYTHILEMDADLSHPPEALPRLLEAAAGADLVLGSRYVAGGGVAGWPAHRRLISRAGSLYARTCSASASATSPAGSSASTGGCSRRPTSSRCTGRGTCSRSSSPTARCAWAAAWSRCRSRSATAPPGRAR